MTRLATDELLQMIRSGRIAPDRVTVDGVRGEAGLALLGMPVGPTAATNPFVRARRGRREDLGGIFFRSQWEANVARYLNWLGLRWEYENRTFEFPIRHGITRYTPDFWLPDLDEFWEVKGYMDSASKTKLKRMARYYPNVTVRVIGRVQYNEMRKWARLIPGWEE